MPDFATAEGCNLISCAMLAYLYADTEEQADVIIGLLLSMLTVVMVMLFVLAWIFDVYLRGIIGHLLSMLRGERCCMDWLYCLHLLGEEMMKAALIAQMILASVMTETTLPRRMEGTEFFQKR